jgi:hypothetical protein
MSGKIKKNFSTTSHEQSKGASKTQLKKQNYWKRKKEESKKTSNDQTNSRNVASQGPRGLSGTAESDFRSTISSKESEDPFSKLDNLDFPGLAAGRVAQPKYSYALNLLDYSI